MAPTHKKYIHLYKRNAFDPTHSVLRKHPHPKNKYSRSFYRFPQNCSLRPSREKSSKSGLQSSPSLIPVVGPFHFTRRRFLFVFIVAYGPRVPRVASRRTSSCLSAPHPRLFSARKSSLEAAKRGREISRDKGI